MHAGSQQKSRCEDSTQQVIETQLRLSIERVTARHSQSRYHGWDGIVANRRQEQRQNTQEFGDTICRTRAKLASDFLPRRARG
jgi:hypothetical protein